MYTHKSAEVAGILGIVLGGVGAMDVYLGNRRRAVLHIFLLVLSLILTVVDVIVLPLVCATTADFADCAGLRMVLEFLVISILMGNFLWGALDGILVLMRGDDGLVRRGYRVSNSRMSARDARSVVGKS